MATINGTSGNDSLTGTSANDSFVPGSGNDTIGGGGGTDTVTLTGPRTNYSITQTFTGYLVTDTVGATGTKTVSDITLLQFSDTVANLGIAATARTISAANLNSLIELYVAFFNRVPEASGLKLWIDYFKAGHSLNEIAGLFYDAGVTFSSLTGYSANMTNADFVTVIYANVLGRTASNNPPSAAEIKAWADQLLSGEKTHGTLVTAMLAAAHTFANDPTWGWVPSLLDNKVATGVYHAVTAGVDYLSSDAAISHGMNIAAAVTSTSTAAALTLIGLSAQTDFQSPPMPA